VDLVTWLALRLVVALIPPGCAACERWYGWACPHGWRCRWEPTLHLL